MELMQESAPEDPLPILAALAAICIIMLNFFFMLVDICLTETAYTTDVNFEKIGIVLAWSFLVRGLYELHKWLYKTENI